MRKLSVVAHSKRTPEAVMCGVKGHAFPLLRLYSDTYNMWIATLLIPRMVTMLEPISPPKRIFGVTT
ncbi:hypothetical protein E2C01_051942 [Portunus trituberculatus]|uniref:Uncharacterized protein n=1 Tax=Portunus trituberculatus TaxID=210409 RepID=A0A5B7GCC0_PORTR|nr:hypothetical protein [Portunus trituberculatus]